MLCECLQPSRRNVGFHTKDRMIFKVQQKARIAVCGEAEDAPEGVVCGRQDR